MSINISSGKRGMGHSPLANLVWQTSRATLPIRRSIIVGLHLRMSFGCYAGDTELRLTNDLFGIEAYLALTGLDDPFATYQGLRAPRSPSPFHRKGTLPWLFYLRPVGAMIGGT
jgi:hypothetical protein